MLIAVIVLGVLVLVLLYVVLKRPGSSSESQSALMLKADVTELNKSVEQLKDSLQKQLSEQLGMSNKQMAAQFAASSKNIAEVTQNLTELKESNKQVVGITD